MWRKKTKCNYFIHPPRVDVAGTSSPAGELQPRPSAAGAAAAKEENHRAAEVYSRHMMIQLEIKQLPVTFHFQEEEEEAEDQ